jgi:hypothetical protein
VLRLYEAATDPDGADVEKIRRYGEPMLSPVLVQRYGGWVNNPVGLRNVSLDWVAGTVRWMVAEECYPELYQEGDTFRQGFGFKTLLGAMYLQMMWLMTAKGKGRYCQAPGCSNIFAIDPPEESFEERRKRREQGRRKKRSTYSNKIYCSQKCVQRAYDHRQRQART